MNVTMPPPVHRLPPPRPRITAAEPLLVTMTNASTIVREAAYAGLPIPTAVLVPDVRHVWLLVDRHADLIRWADWLGRPTPDIAGSLTAETHGVRLVVGTVI